MKSAKRTRGFTLIEVMLVLVILGGLAALAVVTLGGRQEKSKRDLTKVRLKHITSRLEQYNVDLGGNKSEDRHTYPTDEQGLTALVTKPQFDDETKGQEWAGPYLTTEELKDFWGQEFRYRLEAVDGKMVPRVSSDGADGTENTDDDIKSWTEDEG